MHLDFLKRLIVFLISNTTALTVGAVTGLLLVRWMSVEQYAIYTVAVMTLGGISVLSRGGSNIGFAAILGRTWPDRTRAADLIPALQQVRFRLLRLLMPPVLLLAFFMLLRAGADTLTALALLCLLVGFWRADIHGRVVDHILAFAHKTTSVQLLDLTLAIAKLSFISLVFLLGGLNALTALLASLCVATLRIVPIRLWLKSLLPPQPAVARPEDIAEISQGVRRHFPAELFLIAQAQIVLLVLALNADAAVLAGFGALTRLATILAPTRALNQALFIPLANRQQNRILSTILAFTTLMAVPGLILCLIAWFAPQALLWLLGPQYAFLQSDLLLMALCLTFTQISGEFFNLVSHRGWVRFSALQILIGIAWLIVAFAAIDLSTLSGVLLLNAGFSLGPLFVGLIEIATHRQQKALA